MGVPSGLSPGTMWLDLSWKAKENKKGRKALFHFLHYSTELAANFLHLVVVLLCDDFIAIIFIEQFVARIKLFNLSECHLFQFSLAGVIAFFALVKRPNLIEFFFDASGVCLPLLSGGVVMVGDVVVLVGFLRRAVPLAPSRSAPTHDLPAFSLVCLMYWNA